MDDTLTIDLSTGLLSALDQRVLRRWGTWQVRWILVDPEHGIKHAKDSMAGGTWDFNGQHYWMATTSKGIELYLRNGDGHGGLCGELWYRLLWSKLHRFVVEEVEPGLREDLRVLGEVWTQHQQAYPVFKPGSAVPRCKDVACAHVDADDPTYRALLDEHAVLVEQWYAVRVELEAEERDLLNLALPLGATT